MTDNRRYTVELGFTVKVNVSAKNVQDAVNIALIEYDPKKVTMDREVYVFEEGTEAPIAVRLTK